MKSTWLVNSNLFFLHTVQIFSKQLHINNKTVLMLQSSLISLIMKQILF